MRDSSSGRPMPSPSPASSSRTRAATPSPSRTAPRSRGEPRAKARRETARAISGADAQADRAVASRKLSWSMRKPTASSRDSIWRGSRSGLASRASKLARAGSRNCAVDGAEQASLLLARSRARQFQARAACRIDEQDASRNRIAAAAATPACVPICVSSTYFKQRADRGQLGPREVAEAAQLGHLQLLLQVQLRRRGCRSRPPAPALPPRRRARPSA